MDTTQHVDNLRAVLDRADPLDIAEGMGAYARYQGVLTRLSKRYGVPLPRVVGAFSALSPNNDYHGNLRSTVSALDGYARGIPDAEIVVSTYRACLSRALRALRGEPFLSFTKGPKTRAFYLNVLDPYNPVPVTIDGHMVGAWFGERLRMVDAVRRRWRYEEIADGVRLLARERGILPNQAQAILWHTWKRIHNVKFQSQLSLFPGGRDADLCPDSLRPFRRTTDA